MEALEPEPYKVSVGIEKLMLTILFYNKLYICRLRQRGVNDTQSFRFRETPVFLIDLCETPNPVVRTLLSQSEKTLYVYKYICTNITFWR